MTLWKHLKAIETRPLFEITYYIYAPSRAPCRPDRVETCSRLMFPSVRRPNLTAITAPHLPVGKTAPCPRKSLITLFVAKGAPGCEFKDKDGLVGAEWWSKATGRGHNTTATCSCFEQLLCPVLVARLTYWHYCPHVQSVIGSNYCTSRDFYSGICLSLLFC